MGILADLKKIKIEKEEQGFTITALREIMIMKKLCHKNILQLLELQNKIIKIVLKEMIFSIWITPKNNKENMVQEVNDKNTILISKSYFFKSSKINLRSPSLYGVLLPFFQKIYT